MKTPWIRFGFVFLFVLPVFAHLPNATSSKPVLAPLANLQRLQVPIWHADEKTGVGFSYLTPEMQEKLGELSHAQGKCGGFEVLDENENGVQELANLRRMRNQSLSELYGPVRILPVPFRPEIEAAVKDVQPMNVKNLVTWLSSFTTRHERSTNKNAHVFQMKTKAEEILKAYTGEWQVDLIDHKSSQQKSLRVRLLGRLRPNEIFVVGGHHDSTTGWMSSPDGAAPGADDNASGSAGLFEILRVLSTMEPSERTVEIMWYAAEESGLLGSAEIAKAYKDAQKDVVGVLQMDMTGYAGSGVGKISNISDFTAPWLQNLMKELNQHYTKLEIVDDPCGYACSDHASWYRQGYAAVVPFESLTKGMNPKIHSKQDLLPLLNFDHAASITRLSLAVALEMANSNLR